MRRLLRPTLTFFLGILLSAATFAVAQSPGLRMVASPHLGPLVTDGTHLYLPAGSFLYACDGTIAACQGSNYSRMGFGYDTAATVFYHAWHAVGGTGTVRGIRLDTPNAAAGQYTILTAASGRMVFRSGPGGGNVVPDSGGTNTLGDYTALGWPGIESTGRILSNGASASQGIGYDTGAGGTVTQLTSKSTGVTLARYTGEITMNNAALAGDTAVTFTLTNSLIAAGYHVLVSHVSAGTVGSYTVTAVAAAGSADVTVRNITTGSLSEAIVLKFTVLRAVTS